MTRSPKSQHPETKAEAIVYAQRLAVEADDADTMTCTEGEPVFYFE